MGIEISNFKLAIGVPLTWTHVPSGFFDTFAKMKKPDYIHLRADNGPIDELRNNLVEWALDSGCSHLLMLDTDHLLHPMVIPSLLAHKLPIVSALTFRRYPPFDPIMLKGRINNYTIIDEWEPNSLVEVDATGTGIIMYEMGVFLNMKPPWFKFRKNPSKKLRDKPDTIVGEDIGFCSRLKNAGYKIFVDTAVPCKHLSMFAVCEQTYQLYKRVKMAQREVYGSSEYD